MAKLLMISPHPTQAQMNDKPLFDTLIYQVYLQNQKIKKRNCREFSRQFFVIAVICSAQIIWNEFRFLNQRLNQDCISAVFSNRNT